MKYRYPFPPFPDGWFQVAYSHDLPNGAVRPLRYFGKDLVLFRTESGEARVLDAHCPHLGAHLGHGGKVVGEVIECPFHAWRFNGNGECAEIPYAKKIPKKSSIACWPLREVNGMIMVWHHGKGEPPQWEIPALPEYKNDEWTSYNCRSWTIRTHNQEMAENSVDAAHFLYLHGTQEMPVTTAEPHGHLLHVHSETVMRAFGTKVKGAVDVQMFGFGFTLTRFTGIVETLLISSAIPIDEYHCQINFTFTVKKAVTADVTALVGEKFQAEIQRQLEADIPIWENKVYFDRPMLCDGDGPVGIFRKWVRQFYSMEMPKHLLAEEPTARSSQVPDVPTDAHAN